MEEKLEAWNVELAVISTQDPRFRLLSAPEVDALLGQLKPTEAGASLSFAPLLLCCPSLPQRRPRRPRSNASDLNLTIVRAPDLLCWLGSLCCHSVAALRKRSSKPFISAFMSPTPCASALSSWARLVCASRAAR